MKERSTHKESFKSKSMGAGGLLGDCQNKPKDEDKELTVYLAFMYISYCYVYYITVTYVV